MDTTDLGRRTFSGLAKFMAAMALLLFVPAWSLRFWQAWLYLLLFGGACCAATVYFLRTDPALVQRRLAAGPTAEKEPTQRRIMTLASASLVLLIVIPAFDHRWHWSAVPTWLVIVGDIGVLAGYFLVVLVLRQNSFAAATIQVESGQQLVTTGAYAVVRHPMYAAAMLMFAFTPLALGSYWGLLVLIVMVPAFIWRLLDEERFMLRHLPGYADYQARTPYRLLPLVW
jgi:protein-S-isoprenylcysteine O-methyltransferase Ste14